MAKDKRFISTEMLLKYLVKRVEDDCMELLYGADIEWNPAWEDALDIITKRPVYECRSAPELVGLLDKLTRGYFAPVKYKKGYPSENKYSVPKVYKDASRDKMNERNQRHLMKLSLTKGYLYHGTPLEVARAIQQSGFLSPADPSFRNALDATKDGFLSFATSDSMAITGIKLRMRISQADITRWQFKQAAPFEVVTTLAVPTYRLEWLSRNGVWKQMDLDEIPESNYKNK